jgi:DNA-binding NtrC family response regulator
MRSEKPGRVLLLNDELAIRRLASCWLEGFGHQVFTAGNPEEAGASFSASVPEIMVLDLVMLPRLAPQAGLNLIPSFSAAPVIVLTAHANNDLTLQTVERGAWEFLAKPVEPDLLRPAVSSR